MTQQVFKAYGNGKLRGLTAAATLCMVLLGLLAVPQGAHAWPTKFTDCATCHSTVDATATITTAINGVVGTAVTVAAGGSFQIDWKWVNATNATGGFNAGTEIMLPANTWTITPGTANSPAIAGWNTVWDAADGHSWSTANGFTVGTLAGVTYGYTIDYGGSPWDSDGSKTRNPAADGAGTGGTDRDGVADTMGTDAIVTVPAGATSGNYTIHVLGVGHEGSAKSYISQAITVTVTGGSDVTPPSAGPVTVSPEYTTYVPGTFTISTPFTDADSAVTSCQYTVNGVTWLAGAVSGGGPYTCTATPAAQANGTNLTINMRATSGGGTGTATSIARTVDAAAPSTTNNAPAGWQPADVTVTLTPADGTGSGVASTLYCIDASNSCVPGTSGTSVSVTQAANTAGTQYVRYRSSDNIGNAEVVQSATVQIDKSAPVDGTLTVVPGNSQNALNWIVASDTGSGLRTANTYDVRFVTGGLPPADCASGTSVYTGIATSYTHTGLTNSTAYSYRVCAYDNLDHASAGATGTGIPAAVCTEVDPTLTILEANKQITSGGAAVVYTLQVTNNDSIDCADTTFSLSVNDSNATDFQASTLGTASLLVAPGGSSTTTLTVSAVASPANGQVNDTSVSSAAAGGHGAVTSAVVTTLINLPRAATMNYNVGEVVHVEFRTDTRFNGAGLVSVSTSDTTPILSAVPMLEVQQGTQWLYSYDWDTSGQPADTYMIQITDGGDADPTPTVSVVLDNPVIQMNFFADAFYTTPTDKFTDGATVYAEVKMPTSETGISSAEIDSFYGGAVSTSNTITQTGTTFRYNFPADFTAALIPSGEWGYVYFEGTVNAGLSIHRPIQHVAAVCGNCIYADPSVSIVTTNQTILTDGGTANYTINITNNDSVACGDTSFDLVALDSNTTNFNPSSFAIDPLTVSPKVTASTTLDVTVKPGESNGVSNDTSIYTSLDSNHSQVASAETVTTTLSVADVTPPSVTAFVVPGASTTLAIPVTTFTATDATGVTGYLITESATPPAAGAAGWTAAAPATYTVAASGSYTLYAWAKDAADNISSSLSAPVTVDAVAPNVTSFTAPAASTSQTIPITQFLASDNVAVTGYLITESATPPAAGAAGWTGTAPVTYTVASDGSKTLYPWAKDALGNVSALYGAPASVLVDTVAPSVASTVPANGASAVALNSSVTITFSEPIDCGTINETNIVADSPTWTYDGTSCIASGGSLAVFNTAGQSYSTAYTVSVSAAVKDPAGNSLSPAPANFTYTTLAEPCTYNDPSVTIDTPNQNATVDGDLLPYTVTITNNDIGGCGDTTFSLTAIDNNSTDFDPSTFDSATITLSPLASATRTLTVKPKSGALNGSSNDTYFYTEADANHLQSANSGTVTTIVAVPCNVAPTASITTANQQITTDGGSAAYTIQVQNDNALACGNTAFNLVAVDDNGAAFAVPSAFAVDPLTVAPGGAVNTTTLTVTAQAGAVNGAVNNTYFYTALNGTTPQSGNSNAVTTTISRPCVRVAPTINHGVQLNVAPLGTAVYTLTIDNNDVDCADTTFTLAIDSEVESDAGSFALASALSTTSVTVPANTANTSVTFTVSANDIPPAVDGATLNSVVRLSDATNHAGQDALTSAPEIITTIKKFDPLVHSSLSTASTKHSGDGGWGISGGRYGEFVCGTCHTPSTTNIKRIRTSINTPDPTIATLPGDGATISFLDATDPAADFGNDTTAHATSNRICEVCHTYDPTRANGVKQHAYSMPVAASHENGKDCTSCHKHNAGFSAAGGSCDSCHGYPPNPGDTYGYQAIEGKGAHVKHVNHLAALSGVVLDPNSDSFGDANVATVCGVCHDMNAATHEMGGGTRNINFSGAATFQFGSSAPAYNGNQGDPSSTTPKTCSNINCHFQATPWWE